MSDKTCRISSAHEINQNKGTSCTYNCGSKMYFLYSPATTYQVLQLEVRNGGIWVSDSRTLAETKVSVVIVSCSEVEDGSPKFISLSREASPTCQ